MRETIWSLPEDLLQRSLSIMRPLGERGNEGLALWFGNVEGYHAEVTHVVEVFGDGFRTSPVYMSLSLRAMAMLTDLGERIDAVLVGQIHSHPGRLLELSDLDKAHGIRSQDYLSVVCPFFAQRPLSGISECGVHVFERQAYRRLTPVEIDRRLIPIRGNLQHLRCEVPA